ncbi:MAG TPA: hypothetical protein VJB90_00260 [Candidatus Nanoarchaeia archaeon]|nr:hypothetical protein [Candidatus Nanoarchaeia archaeon]
MDKIKSTITISLGSKNRLRELKGGSSYEQYINYLMRLRNQSAHNGENYIELQKFNRKKGIYSFENFKILFNYNQFNNSPNFFFDISLDSIRENGEKTSIQVLFKKIKENNNRPFSGSDGDPELVNPHTGEYKLYFQLLTVAIQNEVEPLFKHNGRFEDHFSWEQEFNLLNLPKKSFEEDVMEKLRNYKNGLGELSLSK